MENIDNGTMAAAEIILNNNADISDLDFLAWFASINTDVFFEAC